MKIGIEISVNTTSALFAVPENFFEYCTAEEKQELMDYWKTRSIQNRPGFVYNTNFDTYMIRQNTDTFRYIGIYTTQDGDFYQVQTYLDYGPMNEDTMQDCCNIKGTHPLTDMFLAEPTPVKKLFLDLIHLKSILPSLPPGWSFIPIPE